MRASHQHRTWRVCGSVALIMAVTVGASPAHADPAGHDVEFASHGVTLHGTVVAPPEGGSGAGIVMVHGSGPHNREDYRREAEAFAKAGIAVLIYDKRTAGYSMFQRDYSLLADDALAAVQTLRSQPGVDPARVGLWGLSEGGWVAPLAASRSRDVAFVVTVGANGIAPARQQAWATRNRLVRAGVDGSLLDMGASKSVRLLVAAGAFAEAEFDPVPVLERIHQPVLGLWGDLDRLTPPGEAMLIFRDTLERAGNRNYTLRAFAGAQHNLRLTTDGFDRLDAFAPGYLDLVGSWANGVAERPPVATTDTPPRQDRQSLALAPPRWYEAPWLLIGAWAFALLAFAAYPATARLRGHGAAMPAAGPARWLSATGMAAAVAFPGYFVMLMAGGAMTLGPTVFGRPVPWLVLQALAVAVVIAAVVTAARWWRRRGDVGTATAARLGLLLAGAAIFTPWAVYWGLLVP